MSTDEVSFPLVLPSGRGRRWLKVLAGQVLLALNPARGAQLEQGQVDHPFALADRLRIAALVHRHMRMGSIDRLGALQNRFWAGHQAVAFHTQAEARFRGWWLERHSRIAVPIATELEAAPGRYRQLVEIGCGSGLVLNDLSQRLPSLDRLVGLDLCAEQTARNRERFRNRRLHFEAGDAADWAPEFLQAGSIVFTNAGVLEYFPAAKLRGLLETIARKAPALCAFVEPIDADFDLEQELGSLPHGVEHTFSHPYPRYLRDAGFEIRSREDIQFDDQRWLMLVAHKS